MYGNTRVSTIVATDLNGVIGKNGKIPWHEPVDLRYFKKVTYDKPLIMGSKTVNSILDLKDLPRNVEQKEFLEGRFVIPVSHNVNKFPNLYTQSSIGDALNSAVKKTEQMDLMSEIMIGGGASIYDQTARYIDEIFLTKIYTEVDGPDTYFPITRHLLNRDFKIHSENFVKGENYNIKLYHYFSKNI